MRHADPERKVDATSRVNPSLPKRGRPGSAGLLSVQQKAGNAAAAALVSRLTSVQTNGETGDASLEQAQKIGHGWMAQSIRDLVAMAPADLAKVEAHSQNPSVGPGRFGVMLSAARLAKAGGAQDWQIRNLYRDMQAISLPQDQQQEVATAVGAFGLFTPKAIDQFVADTKGVFAGWDSLPTAEARAARFGALVNARLQDAGVPPVKVAVGSLSVGGEFEAQTWTITVSDRLGALNLQPAEQSDLIRRAAATFLHEARHAEQEFTMARALAGKGTKSAVIATELRIPGNIADKAAASPVAPGSPEARAAKAWYESEYGPAAAKRAQILGDPKRHDEYKALPEEADAHALGVTVSDRIIGGAPTKPDELDAGAPAGVQRLVTAGFLLAPYPVVAQRLAVAPPAQPVAPQGIKPADDPKFRALKKDVAAKAKTAKSHPPASAEVKKAQDAAVAPADDKDAQAKAAQADKMAAAKPGGFDKAAFIAAVNAAIAKQAPKSLDEADKFATSGKADQIKSEVMGKVTAGKDQSAKDVTDKTKETPDPSKAVEKPVTPLPAEPPPPTQAKPDPAKAVPDKAPPEQTDLRAGQHETNAKMSEAGVTEQQLAQSNEPEFTGALDAKKQGEQHTATAPAAVRESENKQLSAATASADAAGKAAVAGMAGARTKSGQKGATAKAATKSKDEQDRARITGEIKAIFVETKTKVEGVLNGLDDQVSKKFADGEARAKAAFTADHQARMKKYKDERYAGIEGAARWTYDLFASLPKEADNLFLESKKVYEKQMQVVISDIADFVGQQLGEAKRLIAEGRERVKRKVDEQPAALRKIAGEAAQQFGSQFDELDRSVDEKQQALVEDLAQKYVEARDAVDEEIKALQAENKGLWDKAKEAVGGAIETIGKLKDMLLGVLSRAAGAIELIIAKPIEFLSNLVNAVKTGVMNFGANIVEHLKSGLKAWLLGSLASAGIEIPETFDAKGILKMVLSILGLTWNALKARITRFIPAPVLEKLEQTLDVVKILVSEGVPGLWKWIVEKLGDLKVLVLGQIKEFVIEKIVKAGITWIISMLNPAAAFIKACKAIYDIVMFFVEKAAQIKEFVDSVIDSIQSIARGGAGAVAGLIEKTLAKALPMVLGFLASLLGLGGISEKIKSILEKIQAPVGKVIDKVVGTIVKAGKKIWGKLKGFGGKLREKFGRKDKRSPAERKAALDAAMASGQAVLGDKSLGEKGIRAKLASIKNARKVKKLDLVVDSKSAQSETVHIVGANSPTVHGPTVTRTRSTTAQRSGNEGTVTATGQTAVILPEDREKLIAEVNQKLHHLAHMARDKMFNDPDGLRGLLSRKELERQQVDFWRFRMHFGRAMEEALILLIEIDPKLSQLLRHVGGGGSPVDFIGIGPIEGHTFELTTDHPRAIAEHLSRPQVDSLITYPRVPGVVHPSGWQPWPTRRK